MGTALPAKLVNAFHEGVAETYLKGYVAIADQAYDHTVQHLFLVTTNAMLLRMKKNRMTAYEDAARILPTLEAPFSQQMCMAAAVVITVHRISAGTVLHKLPTKEVTLA